MYGLREISLAELIAATTSGGAPIGGIAIPLTILPLGAGANVGSDGDVPPLGVVVPPAVCPKAEAGSTHISNRPPTRKNGFAALLAQGPFLTLAGLPAGPRRQKLA